MKLSYLHEEFNAAKNEKQLNTLSHDIQQPPDTIITWLDESDPSGKYHPWIMKQLKFGNIRYPEDMPRVKAAIKGFVRTQSKLNNRDINSYRTLHDLEQEIEPHLNIGSKRSGAIQIDPLSLHDVVLISSKGEYKLYEVYDPDSLAELGEGTKWCTRKSYTDCQANHYIDSYNSIYIITKNNIPIIQFTPDFDQVMDRNDEETSLAPYKSLISILRYEAKNPVQLAQYAAAIQERLPKSEEAISKHSQAAYIYAAKVIKGRWPEGEPAIAKNGYTAYRYALNIIKGRWPEGEPAIAKSAHANTYATHVVKGRWPEGENDILNNIIQAAIYAKNTLKRRWPEFEQLAYKYLKSTNKPDDLIARTIRSYDNTFDTRIILK